MIYIDSSELRANSKTKLKNYIEVDELESLTGADIMISMAKIPKPFNQHLVRAHLNEGAILVQVKHGHDLTSSLGNRLSESLWRMKQLEALPYQSVLLFVGYLTSTVEGLAKINNQLSYGDKKNITYKQVLAAINMWILRGGSYHNIYQDRLMEEFFEILESHIVKLSQRGIKKYWPEKPSYYDPQKLEKIDDFRATLKCCDGLGEKRINELYKFMIENNEELSLYNALSLISNRQKEIISLPYWGSGTIHKIRKWYLNK